MKALDQIAATCRNAKKNAAGTVVLAAFALGMVTPAAAQGTAPGAPKAQAPVAAPAAALPPEAGVWLDHTKRGAIEIVPCDNQLCGRIYWLQEPLQKSGQPLVDGNNPDRKKRTTPICGLQIIGGLVPQQNGAWDKGWIYDPEKGESYDLELKLKGPGQLQIVGYMGVKWLSETYLWTRPASNLPRCDVQAAAPAAPKNGTARAQTR